MSGLWVLVLVGLSRGIALEHVPGFATEDACRAAGEAFLAATEDTLWGTAFVCFPLDGVGEP